jgi:outer membrane protein assembly factor BamB
MIQANRDEYVPLDHAKVLDGQDAWGPIAIAGQRMLMRDSKRMVCLDVGVRPNEREQS